jgi:hypothetical protein
MELDPKFVRNTSLQRDIQKHPSLARRLRTKYPDRFTYLAGASYVEVPEQPKVVSPKRVPRKRNQGDSK